MIYLDNAATTYPKPASVSRSLHQSVLFYGANPGRSGYEMCMNTARRVYSVRKKLADFFGADEPENVVFTSNCTHALNIALNGFAKNSSHVLTSCLEHNSVMRPLEQMRKDGRIFYDCVKIGRSDEETVENFKSLLSRRTSLIVCTYASNVFGDILPIRAIGQLAKERNIPFVVDAAQAAGVLNINMKKDNISCLCLPGHKGLYGPMGTGAMILSGDHLPKSLLLGGTGTLSKILDQPEELPERYESGTLNVPGILAFGEGVDFVKNVGLKKIRYHENSLAEYLYSNLSSIEQVKLYHPFDCERRAPVISFNVGDLPCERAGEILASEDIAVRSGFHCNVCAHKFYKTDSIGTVRASVSYFNCKKDIDILLNSIKKIAKNQFI